MSILTQQAPCLAPSRKEQLLYKDATGSCIFEGPYAYVSIDLYSDLCGDEASWGGCVEKTANGNSGQVFREQTGLFEKARRKNNLLDSCDMAKTLDVIRDGQLFQSTKAEVLHPAKLGAMPRVATNLNVLEEETDNDDKSGSPSAHNVQAALDSLEKGSDSTSHEVTEV